MFHVVSRGRFLPPPPVPYSRWAVSTIQIQHTLFKVGISPGLFALGLDLLLHEGLGRIRVLVGLLGCAALGVDAAIPHGGLLARHLDLPELVVLVGGANQPHRKNAGVAKQKHMGSGENFKK